MRRFLGFACIAAAAVILAALTIYLTIYLESRPYLYTRATAPSATTVIIPGAAIYTDGTLSPVFQQRADTAIALYQAHTVAKILVSGDNSTVSHNEVNAVSRYLIANGIPESDIFLDHAGFDTYSTMYRAHAIFGLTKALVATQSFHLPRAIFIARTLGIEAYGVRADTGFAAFHNYVREFFADGKAVLDLAFLRVPKYLGPTIPITGDGRNNP